MLQNGKMLLLGILGLILVIIGAMDFFTTDTSSLVQGEDDTVAYYFLVGVPLLILGIVGLVRQNKKIK